MLFRSKEFRFPLGYANQRPLSAQWTVTGSGAFLVGTKRSHVRITEMILSGLVDEEVLEIAARHHEKLDGTGYHKGLTEKDLTLPQQIAAVADMLSALYGKRSYKDSFDSGKIRKILQEDADNHKISKQTVDCLMEHYDEVIEKYEEQKDETIGLYLSIKHQQEEISKRLKRIVP